MVGYYALTRLFDRWKLGEIWVDISFLVFFGLLGPHYLLLLIGSVVGNILFAVGMAHLPERSRSARRVLTAGITANLVLAGAYFYTGYFDDNVTTVFWPHMRSWIEAYPHGLVSFMFVVYTLLQIAGLLDVYMKWSGGRGPGGRH